MSDYLDISNQREERFIISFYLLICIGFLTGCVQREIPPQLSWDYSDQKVVPVGQHHIAGSTVRGRPIIYRVFGMGEEVIFILGAIHGNEPASATLVRYLADYLHQNPQYLVNRRVIVLPIANPDGYSMRRRENSRGVDINRNFASYNRINEKEYGLIPLSEPEAAVIAELIQQYRPSRIVSVHQPYDCVDYDGPSQWLADRMAQQCGLPLRRIGPQPGSLGSYAGETLGIPTITLEMVEQDSWLTGSQLWQRYGPALLTAIQG
jgi:protein MpaA